MGAWYVTREAVKAALDIKLTARNDAQVDRAIEAASRAVENFTHRKFVPWIGTKYFDYPQYLGPKPWRCWLNQHEVVSVTSLVSGGTTVASSDYFLEPVNDGPPYNQIQIDLSGNATFDAGDTFQRNIAVTGTWGYDNTTTSAGVLSEDLDNSETEVQVSNSYLVGVGDLLKVGTEYMSVTDKAYLDTGVNIDAGDSLTATDSDVTITLSTTTAAPVTGEVILIDSERMLVVDVVGTAMTVKRRWDGSGLAAHLANADIKAPRSLTVVRGAQGSTAATHLAGDAIVKQVYPGPVRDLALAYAVDQILQEQGGYARVTGEGENAQEVSGRGIRAAERRAKEYKRWRAGAV